MHPNEEQDTKAMTGLGQLHINVAKFKNKMNIVACIIHNSQKWDD